MVYLCNCSLPVYQCKGIGGTTYVRETDTFYPVKPTTGQISNADTIYPNFALPILQKYGEPLNGNIVFQSILHGITRGHRSDTPFHMAVLCGTALVLTYTRCVLTHDNDIPYVDGGLEELKNELENRRQDYIARTARRLSRILAPLTFWECVLNCVEITCHKRQAQISALVMEINSLLSIWG